MKLKRKLAIFTAAAAIAPLGLFVLPAGTASAHGYISSPPSRQAQCAQGMLSCGAIKYEPQSVEGPKGLRSCNGGVGRFAELNDDSKPWRATSVGQTVNFTWTFTVRHRTSNFEYYIGNTRVANFDLGNQQPPQGLTHEVNLSGFSGRQKLLAVWNVGDTANAFYACVDLNVGGESPAPTPPPTNPPPAENPGGTWATGTAYTAGSEVTYGGTTYRCLQNHTALPGWEPASTPALWQAL
ncbi:lytic polysaccharide monooxygenase [Actinophytocola gossypii]|uniref:Lytic polysaccharide monooxygenase n=1 Tax=Actinophytocola gossypii TaxID=2812003 RepID=A0ABT2JCE0_9PSEU|nr:lytic polysaccharide monooxygenase [Actinophytocola gossypii]MCT2585436.1 lytic polysaccharide monooxygenase [Actinophytocola gossypii]